MKVVVFCKVDEFIKFSKKKSFGESKMVLKISHRKIEFLNTYIFFVQGFEYHFLIDIVL